MKLKTILLLAIYASVVGCASNLSDAGNSTTDQEISGEAFEASDARVSQCLLWFENIGRNYSATPTSASDLESMAKRIKVDPTLGAILDVGSANRYQNLEDIFLDKDRVLQALRANIGKSLGKPECSAAADEYLESVLFIDTKRSGSLSEAFQSIDDAKLSYKQFLLLTLIFYVSR